MARGGFIDFQSERAFPNFLESGLDASLVFLHCFSVGQARRLRVVLCLAKTAIITAHQDLHLFATPSLHTQNVKVRITSDPVERRLKLLPVPNRTTRSLIKRNRSCHGKAATDRRVNRRIDGCGPSTARKAGHMKLAVVGKSAGKTSRLEVVQADGRGLEKIFDGAADDIRLKQGLVAATAIAGSHARHEHTEHTVTFPQQGFNRALQTITHVRRRGIVIQRAGVAMMHYHHFTIGPLRNEMISEALKAGGQIDAKFVHAGEMAELLYWTGNVGDHIGQGVLRKPFRAPNVMN